MSELTTPSHIVMPCSFILPPYVCMSVVSLAQTTCYLVCTIYRFIFFTYLLIEFSVSLPCNVPVLHSLHISVIHVLIAVIGHLFLFFLLLTFC